MLYNIIFFLKIKIFRKITIKKIINFILTFKNYSYIIRSMNVTSILDCRQVVRQRVLIPSYGGSNPPSPTTIFCYKKCQELYLEPLLEK